MSLLDVESLSVTLGGAAVVRNVSFTIAAGQTVGLVGESGSGKSVTASAILGLLPDGASVTGTIRFAGKTLDEAALARLRGDRLAAVFQEPLAALDPRQRIGDVVAEPLRVRGVPRRAARERAAALLVSVGLAPPRISPETYPHRLSGGQRQRVLIAAALACGPDLLLADEPTTALDATVQARTLDLLADLAAQRGMAMLLISHDLGVVAQQAARVLVMYAGTLVEAGDTQTVFARLAHPYTRALFAAAPHTAPDGRPVPIPGSLPDARNLPPGCVFAPRCARASSQCAAIPPLIGEAAHAVACWHPW